MHAPARDLPSTIIRQRERRQRGSPSQLMTNTSSKPDDGGWPSGQPRAVDAGRRVAAADWLRLANEIDVVIKRLHMEGNVPVVIVGLQPWAWQKLKSACGTELHVSNVGTADGPSYEVRAGLVSFRSIQTR